MAKKPLKSTSAAVSAALEPGLVPLGKPAPAFDLRNQAGHSVQLRDLKSKWVVLYFYPKDDTPGCTTQACAFRDQSKDFTDRGVIVLGISPDDEQSHARFAARYKLSFDLLADPDHAVCERYGVWREKSMYGRTFMGVVRTTYLISPAGKVAHRWDKVKVEAHQAAVLTTIDELR
jgi:peroxiredoxin Q/BCP